MGMYYYISTDVETNCKDNFPHELSYFFDQIGGYGEKSMVSQVEQILDINLSTFQVFDFIENEKPDSIYWKDIDEFECLIDIFIEKIEKKPDYYKEVQHHLINYSDYNFCNPSKLYGKIFIKQLF